MKLIINSKIKYPLVILLALFIIAGGFYYFFNKDAQEAAAWFNDDWNYRQIVPITNAGTTLTDYQVSFTLNTSALITAGKMQSDCDDLRVADFQGNVLPYWIEENNPGCNQTNTIIWTKVPSLAVTTTNIFVYYGNTQATSLQKGSDVFTFFDDFNGAVVDSSKWTINRGSFNIASGKLQAHPAATSDNMEPDISANGQSAWTDYIVETRMYSVTQGGYEPYPFVGVRTSNTSPSSTTAWFAEWGTGYSQGTIRPVINNVDASWWQTWADTWVLNTWYKVKIIARGTNMDVYKDGSLKKTQDMSTQNSATGGISLGVHKAAADNSLYYDYVFTRTYAATEPTIGSLGSEEKGGGPVGYWRFDEGQGTTTKDSTTYANTASITGATWLNDDQCVSSKCLSYNGSTNYTSIPNTAQNNFTSAITMSAWVKLNSYTMGGTNTDRGSVMIKASSYYMSITAGTGKLASFFYGVDANHRDSNSAVPLNQWTHVAITWDGSNIRWYINGVLDKTYAATGTITASGNPLNIGVESAGYGRALNAFIDEAKVYNYARSQAQIQADYNAAKFGAGSAQGANVVLGARSQKWMSDGLVGYWKMDETAWTNDCSTATAIDNSGNNYSGKSCPASTGPTGGASGKFGKAGSFDGGDDYIDMGSFAGNPISDPTGYSMTWSAWVKPTDDSDYKYVLSSGGQTSSRGIHMDITPSENLRCSYKTSSLSVISSSTAVLPTTRYSLATCVFDTSTNKLNFYIDGKLDSSFDASLSGNSDSFTDLTVGTPNNNKGTMSYAFNGNIDEVRIYKRAFSALELMDLYNWAPGPVGYWKLDDNTGTTAVDSSGNGYNGSFTNSPVWTVGKKGSALNFTGTNKYVTVPTMTGKYGGALTVSAWVYHTASSDWDDIVAGGCGDILFGFSNNQLNFGSQCNSPVTMLSYATNINNGWHYVTATYDGTTSKLFVDGNQVATAAKSGSFTPSSLQFSRTGEDFQGIIDDVVIYNYARNPRQILEDMYVGSGKTANHWRLDEGQGNTANNDVTGGANGSITAGTWSTTAKAGKSLSFNGTSSVVAIPYPLGTVGPAQLSITTWFKRTRSGTQEYVVDSDGDESTIYLKSDNKIRCEYWNGSAVQYTDSNKTITDTNWHHAACILDYGNSVKIYIDGVLDNTNSAPSGGLGNGAITNSYIGARGITTNFFSGNIDEVKMYAYALTDAEVKKDYNSGGAIALGVGIEAGDTGNAPTVWLKMDDNTSTTAVDSSGNGNDGTLNSSPTWKAGKLGSSLYFDGSAANVSVNSFNGQAFYSAGTISFWVNLDRWTTTDNIFGTATGNVNALRLERDSSGTLRFIWGDSSGNYSDLYSASAFSTGSWKYITLVWDQGANTKTIYIDGQYNNKTTGGYWPSTWPYLKLGTGFSGRYMQGRLDDFKLYNYARTQAQVAYDYNRGKPVAYWSMDEGDGNIARDFSGNGNNGTITIGGTGTQSTIAQAWANGVSGKYGKSLNFDGTDDYVSASNLPNLKSETGSFSYWINLAAADRNHGVFHLYENNTADYIRSYISSGNVMDLVIEDGDVAQLNVSYDLDNLGTFTNQWLHITWVQDGTSVKLYINGKQVSLSGTNNGDWWTDHLIGTLNWRIGISWYYLQGKVDDFRVYNYALDANQVKQVMNEGGAVRF